MPASHISSESPGAAEGRRIGVGFLGAGPVTQAIHLPTLARLTDTFRVETVMDVSAEVATSVAARVGARATTSVDDLLADPLVEIVAICSPHQFHAEQVIAACRAGKKAVLCEKPFAMSGEEAAAIAAVSAETGVPIVVGAMHAYDPGWLAAVEAWGSLPQDAHTIRSSIVLPPNPRFEDFATEVEGRQAPAAGGPAAAGPAAPLDPEVVAGMITGGVMGLAIHDLPLIRRALGARAAGGTATTDWSHVRVVSAEVLAPFGYLIVLRVGAEEATAVTVELHAVMSANWAPNWALDIVSDDTILHVEFTPSYVHAGSATSELRRDGRRTVFGPFDHNGYEGEWRHLADVLGGAAPLADAATLIDDLTFALSIAASASEAAVAAVDAAGAVRQEVAA